LQVLQIYIPTPWGNETPGPVLRPVLPLHNLHYFDKTWSACQLIYLEKNWRVLNIAVPRQSNAGLPGKPKYTGSTFCAFGTENKAQHLVRRLPSVVLDREQGRSRHSCPFLPDAGTARSFLLARHIIRASCKRTFADRDNRLAQRRRGISEMPAGARFIAAHVCDVPAESTSWAAALPAGN